MFAPQFPSPMPAMAAAATLGPPMWQQPHMMAPAPAALAPMGGFMPPTTIAPMGGCMHFAAGQPALPQGLVTPMVPAPLASSPSPAVFPPGFEPGTRVQLRSVAADSRFAGKVFVVLPVAPDHAGQLRVRLEDGSMALSMSPQFLAPAGSMAEPQIGSALAMQQPAVAANGLQPGDLVRFKGQVVNRTYEGKFLTVETADVGDGTGRARLVVQHDNGQVARLAIDPSFLELLSQVQAEAPSQIYAGYQTAVAGGISYDQGPVSEAVNPVVYQTVEPVSANPVTYQTVVPAGTYEATAPAPGMIQENSYVPAFNAVPHQGPSMTTTASYIPAPAGMTIGAYGAGEIVNNHATIAQPNYYAPAPTYGTAAATTIGAAGATEISMAPAGGWSYAPPPGAYGATATPSHTYGAGAPSTTYGNFTSGATAAPALYGLPAQGTGGWSYAPPPQGADAPYAVA